jgi:transposase-like protein
MKKQFEQGITKRYSIAFKQKVISEIEEGKYTQSESGKIYGISQGAIHYWLKRHGKYKVLNKIVRIEMKGEKDRIKQLEKEKRALESALAQSHLKTLYLESLVEIAEEKYGVYLKKKSDTKESDRQGKKKNMRKGDIH